MSARGAASAAPQLPIPSTQSPAQPRSPFQIICGTNGHESDVSADAAGIIATLLAFVHLSFKYPVHTISEGYSRFYEYAADHPESAEIFHAID